LAGRVETGLPAMTTTVLDSLNAALHGVMTDDDRVVVLGEDILDPYGGAFKVTRGLSTTFPDRVITTPVSEAGIVGVATGMALQGLRPVVEIMFGDFTTLIADQLLNHAAKFRWMFNEQVRVPLVVRAPMGGRRGYGPTHSQSIEKLFIGAPGLKVFAPAACGDPGALLRAAVEDDEPVLFVEHKIQYLSPLWAPAQGDELEVRSDATSPSPTYTVGVRNAGTPAVTIAAYGHMADLARQAVERLAYEAEVLAELVVLTQLAPLDPAPVAASVSATRHLLVIEEGTGPAGFGAELIARLVDDGVTLRKARRLAAPSHPIPASGALESLVLPDVDDIVKAAQEVLA
jgi:pyruvate/2-oxoglutarate/acetoin dehydrogenase E1 component